MLKPQLTQATMVSLIVDLPKNRELLENGSATLFERDLCSEFDAHITENYPWHVSGMRLGWGRIPNSMQLPWNEVSDEETEIFISNTSLGKFTDVAVIFSGSQPGLICTLQFAKANIDLLSFHCPGLIYIVPLSDAKNRILEHDAFIEIDGVRWISGFRVVDVIIAV
ncbi:hypothetical protein UNDYM_4107 [Undibacterium sp. YM2]|uniref:hypothetical protein n=1 Tax=Undibacterium sp. YM2 TaxID=2058625 RepID=UPI001331E451|nr:hypothetical protein [Undibacterium sp. YM2]BBB68360.1 hypothetical protein UNDYM_4107 [Undibacterium sp. YM2]